MEVDLTYLTFNASYGGFALFYRGKPIGGEGDVSNDLPGPHRLHKAKEHNRQARAEMTRLTQGTGRPKFITAIRQIDSELAKQWPDAPRPGDYVDLGGERHTAVDHVCTYGRDVCVICDIHGVDYSVTRDPANDTELVRHYKLAFPQAIH